MPVRPTADRLVLTGAGGWFGRAFLDRVRTVAEATGSAPPEIVAVVRDRTEADLVHHVAPDARVVEADLTDRSGLVAAVSAVSTPVVDVTDVVHAAGVIHPVRFADFESVNHQGTRNVVHLVETLGARRLVHLSSNSPFGTNPTPRDTFGEHEPYHPYLGYGRSKMAAELAVAEAVEAGLDAVIVRPPWFYGPFQPARQTTFFSMVRTGRFPVFGSGDQRRSMVHVHNLADGVLGALGAFDVTGRAYWIADARPYTVAEIVSTVRQALEDNGLECSDRTVRLPVGIARIAGRVDSVLQSRGRYQQQLHVLGEMGHTIAVDITAARRDLAYDPGIDLVEGMRASVAWCLEQGFEL